MNPKTQNKKLLLERIINDLPASYLQEVIDFVEYLKLKSEKGETMFLSEESLAKEWLAPEEEEAWKDL
jgi:hypothetical protein